MYQTTNLEKHLFIAIHRTTFYCADDHNGHHDEAKSLPSWLMSIYSQLSFILIVKYIFWKHAVVTISNVGYFLPVHVFIDLLRNFHFFLSQLSSIGIVWISTRPQAKSHSAMTWEATMQRPCNIAEILTCILHYLGDKRDTRQCTKLLLHFRKYYGHNR